MSNPKIFFTKNADNPKIFFAKYADNPKIFFAKYANNPKILNNFRKNYKQRIKTNIILKLNKLNFKPQNIFCSASHLIGEKKLRFSPLEKRRKNFKQKILVYAEFFVILQRSTN